MFGIVRVVRTLLPALRAAGAGHVVLIGSIAGHQAYAGGGGYNAAKFAVRAVRDVLRHELLGEPIRVTEIAPGMVDTEFSLVRFGGDAAKATATYAGMTPLTAEDVAHCVAWAVTRPTHVTSTRSSSSPPTKPTPPPFIAAPDAQRRTWAWRAGAFPAIRFDAPLSSAHCHED